MAYIYKSYGGTKTEHTLAMLCDKSFMNLWSYSNVFRRDGNLCKELCDLLVVCDKYVIIFSDKEIAFTQSSDIGENWKRWKKKAILKSAKQIVGAERCLLTNPNEIYLDPKCTQPFPLQIPSSSDVILHRIVVANGARATCKKVIGDDIGSLMVTNDESYENSFPFSIGDINPKGGYIHVVDDFILNVLLNEFDTIVDFSNYLSKKEQIFRSDKLITAAGEEELVAIYSQHINEEGEHDFILNGELLTKSDATLVAIDKGHWREHKRNPQYLSRKELDKISYFWDRLITRFTENIIDGSILSPQPNLSIDDMQQVVKLMALEDRFSRRILSQSIREFITLYTDHATRAARIIISPSERVKTPYLFLLFPTWNRESAFSQDEYRKYRTIVLYAYCVCALQKYWPKVSQIVGIATDYPNNSLSIYSEDAIYLEIPEWNEEWNEIAERGKKDFNIMNPTNATYSYSNASEYPHLSKGQEKRIRLKAKRQARKKARKNAR